MDFTWKEEYKKLAAMFIKQHFGGSQGLTRCFPCMREGYPWADFRPDVMDSRVPAKNNTEYHGLEKHAMQYHATAQYEYAYHHWLMAAWWRRQDMIANNFNDSPHTKAVDYCVKQAFYNKSLDAWQKKPTQSLFPKPLDFHLTRNDISKKEKEALKELEEFEAKCNKI